MPGSEVPDLEYLQRLSGYFRTLLNREENVQWLLTDKNIYRRYPLTELYKELRSLAFNTKEWLEWVREIRRWKQRHFLRIGAREFLGLSDFKETTSQISEVAEVALQVGLDLLWHRPKWWLDQKARTDWAKIRDRLSLVVMGLGKLGGQELNYVSDVDLFFLHGSLSGGQNFSSGLLVRLTEYLSKLLRENLEGDRVFRVDLTLRPAGSQGKIVVSVDSAVNYYQSFGQTWERQALLKARPVAGDRDLAGRFLQEVRPFVFRRFLDFQAIEEIKRMRDRILRETEKAKGHRNFDLKLGRGGIREVEFIVQTLQLIYGGRIRDLINSNTLQGLQKLYENNLISNQAKEDLTESYIFLRRLEHWVQLDVNRPEHCFPKEEKKRAILAEIMGCEPKDIIELLQEKTHKVHGHFQDLFEKQDSRKDRLTNSYQKEEFLDLKEIGKTIGNFHPEVGRTLAKVLDLIRERQGAQAKETSLRKIGNFLEQISTRPGLLGLVNSQPKCLKDLFYGLGVSDFVLYLLKAQPSLVEGLAMSSQSRQNFGRDQTCQIVDQDIPFEEAVEWIRRLKNERLLDLAVQDLSGQLSQLEVNEHLSNLADFVLQTTLEKLRQYLRQDPEVPLAVMALGKLGSREMSWLSDLDLMFVYAPREEEPQDRIPEGVIRLIQRFLRLLTISLQEGPGYKVDLQIRPSGNYGPIVVTQKSWQAYYSQEADIWEVQSLLSLRRVAGHEQLGRELEDKAKTICFQARGPEQVWPRLCQLRERMEKERSFEKEGFLDLKLGYGGQADLEFLVQGAQLLFGHARTSLQEQGLVNLLPVAVEELGIDKDKTPFLQSSAKTLRRLKQRLQLIYNQESSRVKREQLEEMLSRDLLSDQEGKIQINEWSDLVSIRHRIREIWTKSCTSLAH